MESLVRRYYRTTGIKALDDIIYGWPRSSLALVYGSQKAGKTTLAMQAAIQIVMHEKKHVLYLDTESGGVSELRLYSLASALGIQEADIPRTISMIKLFQAGELHEQHKIIMDDWDNLRKTFDVGMFIVDSVAMHYHRRVMNAPAEHVGSVAREILGKLEVETNALLNYAKNSGATVLYTSWSASKAKKAFEAHQLRELEKQARKGVIDLRDLDVVLGTYGEDYIGGRFLGYVAKVIARIWRLQGDLRFFVVEAHREKPDNIGIYMRLTEKGLQPAEGASPVRLEAEMKRRLVQEEEVVIAQDSDGSGEAGQPSGRRMGRRKN